MEDNLLSKFDKVQAMCKDRATNEDALAARAVTRRTTSLRRRDAAPRPSSAPASVAET